ncbi:MAG: 3-isopropylmalate dehydratase small subunit [Andreesenia angusta]|nr:3-isopropylmalate dehydratase small subunit [Andreesenia angusta]
MEPLIKVKGIVTPMDRANVDTDAIIPKQFLKRIERTGFGQFLFYEFRYDKDGNEIKDFELNQDKYKGSNILIARDNFGCGSSREHAPWALEDYGFRVIIAPSFADIFYNNCFNNGILPIVLSEEELDKLFEKTKDGKIYELEVDLEDKIIRDDEGLEIPFDIDDFRRKKLLEGLDDIGITLGKIDIIEKFEKNHVNYI